jgi:hypothetical protein
LPTSAAAYYGAGKSPVESYAFWSNSAPGLNLGIDIRVKDLDYPALRRLIDQRHDVAPYYYGDFYPLSDGNSPRWWMHKLPGAEFTLVCHNS